MSKIIVAVDESQGSRDAIALASTLADITGCTLLLVNVFPYDLRPSRALNSAFEAQLRQDSRELLDRLRSAQSDETIEVKAIANPSPSHGLHELAEQEHAVLIVLGSTHRGRVGRVLPGSTAERLLHGAPCPVAVAPSGYAERSGKLPTIVGCGYDGSPSARHALKVARRIAATTGARLRIISAFEPLAYDLPRGGIAMGGLAPYNDTLHERTSTELDSAVASIESETGVDAQFAIGDPARILAAASEELDLLLVGSRGYGPIHAVLVGGVSGRLITEAACPVIVLPRSAGDAKDDAPFAKAATARTAVGAA
jgi:nucleotide-binding universal stress UspA family protein